MTAQELRNFFNKTYGIHKEWPRTFEVDMETYLNVAQEIINWEDRQEFIIIPNTGKKLMFKSVELILKSDQ